MDQVRQYLALLIRHGFWVGTVVVLLGSMGVWYMTTSNLAAENEDQTSKLDSDVQKVSSVRGQLPEHPNEFSHAEMEELIEGRTEELLKAWTSVFDEQREILVWPEELGPEFVNTYKDWIPIELHVDYPPTPEQKVDTDILNRYGFYIERVVPSYAKIAKTKWTADFDKAGGRGSMGMGMGPGGSGPSGGYGAESSYTSPSGPGTTRLRDEEMPLVRWSTTSQQSLLTDLFPWKPAQPNTLEVYYSQENLWILRQLMTIIAEVNGDAQQPFQAKIHQINQIQIGKSVNFEAGEIAVPGQDAVGGMGSYGSGMGMEGYSSMQGYGGMMSGDGASGSYGEMGMGVAPVEAPDPADNRYVNLQYEKIPADTLRAALISEDPEDAPIAVAKRVPVMMSLNIDQRYIPDLIARCGSAELMVEVRQVRILPPGAVSRSTSGSGSGPGMSSDSYGSGGFGSGDYGSGGYESSGMSSYGGSGSGSSARGGQEEEFPLDMQVEIYGLIYIYNPPNVAALGIEKVTEDTVIDGSDEQPAPADPQPTAPQPTVPPQRAAPQPAGGQAPTGNPPSAPANGATSPGVPTAPGPGNTPAAPGGDRPGPGNPPAGGQGAVGEEAEAPAGAGIPVEPGVPSVTEVPGANAATDGNATAAGPPAAPTGSP